MASGRRSAAPAGRGPRALAAFGVVALVFLALPVAGVVARAPWSIVPHALASPEVVATLRLSLVTSAAATAASVALGLPLAWLLARVDFPGRAAARVLVLLPIVLPPVVGGLALLLVLGRRGLVGRWLDAALGITLPFTTAGAVVAQTLVALPFFVVAAEAALRSADHRLEEAAATLGAGPWFSFARVTLPLVRPAVGAGAVLAWARALGEFGATVTFAGNIPGETQTLPLAVYFALQRRPEDAIALALVLLAVAVVVLFVLRDRWVRIA